MLQRIFRKIFIANNNSEGITLLEAVIATAILGIGFVGVYTISSVSMQTMDRSISRQKLQMQANQILDLIENDLTNIDQYNMLDLGACVVPDPMETQVSIIRSYEWCSRLAGEVGAVAGDERSVNVSTLADGRRVVHVVLEANSSDVQVVMKRIFDD